VALTDAGTVDALADATADFRDQYYGLAGFLVDDDELSPGERARSDDFPPIVTTGLIDLAECRWGAAPTRILKTAWRAPRIDRRRMDAGGALGPWIRARLIPKVLLATQTRVMEVFVDVAGRYVPGIPLITITPTSPERLWHIAAAIASPVCSALALRNYAGAAMNADALKLSARQALRLPIPPESSDWDAAARHFREASAAVDKPARLRALRVMGQATVRAYRVPAEQQEPLLAWWWNRLTGRKLEEDHGKYV
jgi:hypothetical protein